MRVATNGNFGPIRIPPIPTCLPSPLRLQLRTIRDEVPPMSDTAFKQLVDLLTEQHNETLKKVNTLELSVSGLDGQVKVLMSAHNDRVVDRKQDVRKVRDVVLQIAVVLLLTGLLTFGVQYVKGTPEKPAAVTQSPEQAATDVRLDKIIKILERQAEEPAPVTQKPKPRPKPEPQRLNRLREGDLIAVPSMRLPILASNHGLDLRDMK